MAKLRIFLKPRLEKNRKRAIKNDNLQTNNKDSRVKCLSYKEENSIKQKNIYCNNACLLGGILDVFHLF